MCRSIHMLLLVSFFAFVCHAANAQLAIGFRSGMQVSYNNLLFEKDLSTLTARDNITGLVLAIPIEFPSEKMLSFQSGFAYLNKGSRIRFQRQGQSQVFLTKYLIDYIQIPLLAKLSMQLGTFNLFLLGGSSLGYAVDLESLELSYDLIGPPRYQTLKMDFEKAQISRLDMGLTIGAGMEAKIADGKKLFIDARFEFGMTDIDKRSESTVYNGGRSFTMGIMIPVKPRLQ